MGQTRTAARHPQLSSAAEAAVAWMVKLQSGLATPADHDAWQAWKQANPEHAQAWSRLDSVGQRLKTLPSLIAHATLDERAASRPSRRTVLKAVAAVSGTGLLVLAAPEDWSLRHLAADHHTGIGEQARVRLADGSTLLLNTSTAIDERFDAQWRCVLLRHGEVMVDCVPDRRRPARPFVVRTAQGEVRTAEGRFLVRQHAGRTLVQCFTARAEIHPVGSAFFSSLQPGQQLSFDAAGADAPEAIDADASAWTEGMIVARRMRLADLAAELARYRRGLLHCDEDVAPLRISGVFPIARPELVLAAIERTLPVKAQHFTRYWTSLRRA